MNFELSAELAMLRDTARSLLDAESPSALVREQLAPDAVFPERLWRQLGAAGLLGIGVAEASGGSGGSLDELLVVSHELGYRLAPVPWFGVGLAARFLAAAFGDDAVRLGGGALPRALGGDGVVAVAVPEDWWTRTRRNRVLPEHRFLVPWGAAAAHIVFLVGTPASPEVAVVPAPQLTIEPLPMLGTQPVALVTWHENGEERAAITEEQAERALTEMRLARAAELVGGMRQVLGLSVGYAGERQQFGQPIGAFQAIKHRLANLALDTELADLLVWDAASAATSSPSGSWFDAALAKAFAGDVYRKAAASGCQVFGGYGFMLEYDPQLHFRRAKQAQLSEGTSDELYVEATRRWAETAEAG